MTVGKVGETPTQRRSLHLDLRRGLLATIGLGLAIAIGAAVWRGAFIGTTRKVRIGPMCGATPHGSESWFDFALIGLTPEVPTGGTLMIHEQWGQTTRYYYIDTDGSRVPVHQTPGPHPAPSCP